LQLKNRIQWYNNYAKAYLDAAQVVWEEARETKNKIMALAPLIPTAL
jgi:c-di-AMP phosphodiesterase-like protein